MNSFGPIEIGLIVAIVVAIICLILFLVTLKSKTILNRKQKEEYDLKEKQMKASHDEALEKERIQNKKQVTKQKEDFDATVSGKDREIDALKLFSKTKVNMLRICA